MLGGFCRRPKRPPDRRLVVMTKTSSFALQKEIMGTLAKGAPRLSRQLEMKNALAWSAKIAAV